MYLTFVGPCVDNIFAEYNQHAATCTGIALNRLSSIPQPSVLFVIKYYIKIMEHWKEIVGTVCLFLYFLVIFMVQLRLRLWLAKHHEVIYVVGQSGWNPHPILNRKAGHSLRNGVFFWQNIAPSADSGLISSLDAQCVLRYLSCSADVFFSRSVVYWRFACLRYVTNAVSADVLQSPRSIRTLRLFTIRYQCLQCWRASVAP